MNIKKNTRDNLDEESITVLFSGDFFIKSDEKTSEVIESRISESVKKIIKSADIAIINCESPITNSTKTIKKTGPSLKMSPDILVKLKDMGISGLTLANNHIMDYTESGLFETLKITSDSGLMTCGANDCISSAMCPMLFKCNGITIAIFSVCEQEFGIATENSPGSAWISHPIVLDTISKYKKIVDYVIVSAHGGVEYVPFSPPERRMQLHQLIDAGADLIIGHHPHVPQGWEEYKGKFIFYSLGNLIFDYPNKKNNLTTEWGYMVSLMINKKTISSIDLILTEQKNDFIDVIDQTVEYDKYSQYLSKLSDILEDSELYNKFWQELAIRLYYQRYNPWFKQNFCPFSLNRILFNFQHYLTNNCLFSRKSSVYMNKNIDKLILLNIIRNESHSWTIKEALKILSGQKKDLRNSDISSDLNDLMNMAK